MADEKPGYLSTNKYSVSREMRSGFGFPPLAFKDESGDIVLTAKAGGIGRHAILVDPQGKQVGSINKKGISLGRSFTYQFFDGNNAEIGQITIKEGLMGMNESISMLDPNGNAVASASGNFAGFSYEVSDPDGKHTIARISRNSGGQQGGGLGGMLGGLAKMAMSSVMGAYNIEVLDASINELSRLYILELIVVLDTMFHPGQGAGGGFGVGGMPGGIGIKI